MKKSLHFLLLFATLFFAACAKNDVFYGLSDEDWVKKIVKEIKRSDLEQADELYSSFYSEHINSPLLASTMLVLANAHAREHEYKLADFYLDEYEKLYGSKENLEWIKYLKLKNNLHALNLAKRNDALLQTGVKNSQEFIDFIEGQKRENEANPIFDDYIFLASSMQLKYELASYLIAQDSLKLYKRMGHKESVKYYENLLSKSAFFGEKIILPKSSIFRKIIEPRYF